MRGGSGFEEPPSIPAGIRMTHVSMADQSALRSAEKAAAEERAQRDAQEQTDRAAALIARQDSVERHAALHESSLPALGASSSDRLRGSSVALTTASYTPAPKIAGGGGNDHEMTIETCAQVSCLFASLLADAPRHQKVSCKRNMMRVPSTCHAICITCDLYCVFGACHALLTRDATSHSPTTY